MANKILDWVAEKACTMLGPLDLVANSLDLT
jgi:hypothetical protein